MSKLIVKYIIFAAALLAILGLSNCTQNEETVDPLDRIQQKIDHRLYTEAEQDLGQILSADPDNQRARVILASVYIHRAGITVREYFLLERLFAADPEPTKPLINIDVLEKLEVHDNPQFQKALELLHKINNVAVASQRIAEKFSKIPLLTPTAALDIYRALLELEKIKTPSRGSSLYRGVIKLIYFKFLWENQKILSFGKGQLCATKMPDLAQQLQTLKSYLTSMIVDIAAGTPKSEKEFNAKADELSNGIDQVQSLIRNLGNFNQTVAQALGNVTCDF